MAEKILTLAVAFATTGTAWALLQAWRQQAAMTVARAERPVQARRE
jgi:hypothetical protein